MVIASMILLSGCAHSQGSEETEAPVPVTEVVSNITYAETEEHIQITKNSAVKFARGETVPIMLNGIVMGYLKINWVQKLGIFDLNNSNAVKSGVKFSYTMNFHIDFTESFGDQIQKVIYVEPYLMKKGDTVGRPCCVGWSGFETALELHDQTTSGNCEIGLQPEIKSIKGCSLVLKISDDSGNQYDDVALSMKYLTKAEKGPKLLTAKSAAKITCINGGVFSLKIGSVYNENHYADSGAYSEILPFFDYSYKIKYLKAPTSNKKDLIFDSANGNKLRTKFITYVTSDVDSTKLYKGDIYAVRSIYHNKDEYVPYVTRKFGLLKVGKTKKVTDNKQLSDGSGTPKYVRICFEFPEECDARTLKQMKNFKGRFVVFQAVVKERKLKTYDYSKM